MSEAVAIKGNGRVKVGDPQQKVVELAKQRLGGHGRTPPFAVSTFGPPKRSHWRAQRGCFGYLSAIPTLQSTCLGACLAGSQPVATGRNAQIRRQMRAVARKKDPPVPRAIHRASTSVKMQRRRWRCSAHDRTAIPSGKAKPRFSGGGPNTASENRAARKVGASMAGGIVSLEGGASRLPVEPCAGGRGRLCASTSRLALIALIGAGASSLAPSAFAETINV